MLTTSSPQQLQPDFSQGDRAISNPLYASVQALIRLRQYRAALNTADVLLTEGADDEEIWYLRGDALANLSCYHQAIASFQRALTFAASWPEVSISEAVCWLHLDQPQTALAACDRALEIAPTHAQAWLFKGVALHRLGQLTKAYRCYQQALQHQAS
ncbi:MAG: tetratricopeptide repeat protein [Almyronema sp.]